MAISDQNHETCTSLELIIKVLDDYEKLSAKTKNLENFLMNLLDMNGFSLFINSHHDVIQAYPEYLGLFQNLYNSWEHFYKREMNHIFLNRYTDDYYMQQKIYAVLNKLALQFFGIDDCNFKLPKHSAEDTNNVRDIINTFIINNDIEGLDKFYWKMLTQLKDTYNKELNNLVHSLKKPDTDLKGYNIDTRNVLKLEITLYYISTYVPHFCAYCEKLLNHHDYLWLKCDERTYEKGILNELKKDKSLYYLDEIRVDWNDRWAYEKHDRRYTRELQDKGYNFYYCRGLDIRYFPAMRIKVQEVNDTREILYEGLGDIETEIDENGLQKKKITFDVRDLVLTFLENSRSSEYKSKQYKSHGNKFGIKAHDPLLYQEKK